jgi:hypothetical protein
MKPFDSSYRSRDNEVRARHGQIWNGSELVLLDRLYSEDATLEEMCKALERGADGTIAKLKQLGLIVVETSPSPRNNWSPGYFESSRHHRARPGVTRDEIKAFITPQPETTTMSAPNIETKTFIAGVDAANMSDEEIFARILKIENQIKGYDVISNKPKKLQAAMQKLGEDVGALVAFVDARA